MSNAGLTALGVSVIFVANALGTALVFFFKEEVSEKVNTIFLRFALGAMAAPDVAFGWKYCTKQLTNSGSFCIMNHEVRNGELNNFPLVRNGELVGKGGDIE